MEKHYIVYKLPKKLKDRNEEYYGGEVYLACATEPQALLYAKKKAFENAGSSFAVLCVNKVFTADQPVIIEKVLHEPAEAEHVDAGGQADVIDDEDDFREPVVQRGVPEWAAPRAPR